MTELARKGAQGLKRIERLSTRGPRKRLSEEITEQLLQVLRSGAFPEGSKLPPERELAELLGVSRTALREALSAMQLSGLLGRRPGVGTVIARLPAAPESATWSRHLEAGASIAELAIARMAVEMGCIHLICGNTDPNLDEAVGIVGAMRIQATYHESIEGYLPLSLDFHNALARATEAPVLVSLVEDLIARTRAHEWLLVEHYTLEIVEQSLAVHEAILAALQAGDLLSALVATKRHYVEYPVLTGASAQRRAL